MPESGDYVVPGGLVPVNVNASATLACTSSLRAGCIASSLGEAGFGAGAASAKRRMTPALRSTAEGDPSGSAADAARRRRVRTTGPAQLLARRDGGGG
jgi:hypothetical protein